MRDSYYFPEQKETEVFNKFPLSTTLGCSETQFKEEGAEESRCLCFIFVKLSHTFNSTYNVPVRQNTIVLGIVMVPEVEIAFIPFCSLNNKVAMRQCSNSEIQSGTKQKWPQFSQLTGIRVNGTSHIKRQLHKLMYNCKLL